MAPTRRGPGLHPRDLDPSAPQNATAAADPTAGPTATTTTAGERPSWVRLTGDADRLADELLEVMGPAACSALLVALAELLGALR